MTTKKINTLLLEQYVLNELPPDRIKEIDEQIKHNPALQEEIDKIHNSNREILEQYPPDVTARQITDMVRTQQAHTQYESDRKARTSWGKRLAFASPLLAAMIVFFLVVLPILKSPPVDNFTFPDGTRLKGEQKIDWSQPGLVVYRRTAKDAEILPQKATVSQGDLLQIGFVPAGESHGVILSIDGSGTVTLHYPAHPKGSTQLEARKLILLAESYELDDAPGFERFFFITSKKALDTAKLLTKAEAMAKDIQQAKTGNIKLEKELHQSSFLVAKGDKE
ncbi:MAG: hypothetical protein GY765_18100 [bacterium]|nr:hypothetical protein [bacterium]